MPSSLRGHAPVPDAGTGVQRGTEVRWCLCNRFTHLRQGFLCEQTSPRSSSVEGRLSRTRWQGTLDEVPLCKMGLIVTVITVTIMPLSRPWVKLLS